MITYNKGDIYDAKEKIDYYLSHLKEANEIARAGREEILKNHMPQNRVEVIRKEKQIYRIIWNLFIFMIIKYYIIIIK